MRILITNVQLDHRTGTEIVVRDLERELRGRGHAVCVYTDALGVISDEIIAAGGHVVTDMTDVPFTPDVVHAHHAGPTLEAAVRFPESPMVFVCHSRNFWLDMSIGQAQGCQFVAVDRSCAERLVAEGVSPQDIRIISNAVALDRFTARDEIYSPPRRAAIFGNNASNGPFVESVRAACVILGLPLDEFGSGVGRTLDDPEHMLMHYDVVFAKARCAIEATAAGCAVILVDTAGYGGLVTASNVDELLDWNFGDRCLQRPHDPFAIVADVGRIESADAQVVSAFVRARCDLRAAAAAYEDVYRAACAAPRTAGRDGHAVWREAHSRVVQYASELQAHLRSGDGPWSMPPLPATIGGAIDLSVTRAPRRVSPGDAFYVDVEIMNRSREQLASVGGVPVRASYHWLENGTEFAGVFEGVRTQLARSVRPGERLTERVSVLAPDCSGHHRLRVTLVQEFVFWFDTLPVPVQSDVDIFVNETSDRWQLATIAALAGYAAVRDHEVANLGFPSAPLPAMLAFATSAEHVARAVAAGCVALVVDAGLVYLVPDDMGLVVADDPAEAFREIHEALVRQTDFYGADAAVQVDPTARVHPTATIDGAHVVVCAGASIGAHAVVTGRARIGVGAVVGMGAVIGADGLQVMRTSTGIHQLTHAGSVEIADRSSVFANATVARGLFRQQTYIGVDSQVGNNAFVSHNCDVGPRTTIGHGAVINGNVGLGADVWVGPGAILANNIAVGDNARIDLGATVIGTVDAGEHLGGPPAIDHRAMLREAAGWRSRARRR